MVKIGYTRSDIDLVYRAVGYASDDIDLAYTAIGYARPISLLQRAQMLGTNVAFRSRW